MTVSPFSLRATPGTAHRGTRSDVPRCSEERRGGELDIMPVLDVGTGVGYLRRAWSCLLALWGGSSWGAPLAVFWRFKGRGRPGEDDRGSKAGRRDGAGRLMPVADDGVEVLGSGSRGSLAADACFGWGVVESMMAANYASGDNPIAPEAVPLDHRHLSPRQSRPGSAMAMRGLADEAPAPIRLTPTTRFADSGAEHSLTQKEAQLFVLSSTLTKHTRKDKKGRQQETGPAK